MKTSDDINKLFNEIKIKTNTDTDTLVRDDAIRAMSESGNKAPVTVRPDVWRIVMQGRITKIAVAAALIIAAMIVINQFGGSIDGANVAWADVVEKFRSMSFYNAVLYFKEDAASEPKQIELWVSSQHKARLRVTNQVLFAEKGKVVAGYDFKNKRLLNDSEYDLKGVGIVENICKHQALSLEIIVQMLFKGQLVETTPKINSDAMISQDLLVFDLSSAPDSDEWTRIWTLKESKLPVRLRKWDWRDGECLDVFVTYEKQQSTDFFDHKKYEEILFDKSASTSGSMVNLAYVLLKDHGGRKYSPKNTSISLKDMYPVKGHLSKEEFIKYYQANPLKPGQVEFRTGQMKGGLSISYTIPGFPDGHKLMKVGTSARHFVQSYHYPPYGRFRFPDNLDNIFIQYDIFYRDDVSTKKVIELALSKVGIEIIENEEECTVWVAEYNGQKLKDWGAIKCPIPNKKKLLTGRSGPPGSLTGMVICNTDSLLMALAKDQNIVIENKTSIDKKKKLSGVIANFKTKEGAELAEKWYKENFGITFRKEQRKMPVWVVRKIK